MKGKEESRANGFNGGTQQLVKMQLVKIMTYIFSVLSISLVDHVYDIFMVHSVILKLNSPNHNSLLLWKKKETLCSTE